MPSNLKKRVRGRMEKTGESYQAALRQMRAKAETEAAEPRVDERPPSTHQRKYVHLDLRAKNGSWRLSDDANGAVLSVPWADGPLTAESAKEALQVALAGLVVETSADYGATWVEHPREGARDWPSVRGLLYEILSVGIGRWNAGRIRARTGEELIRHPSRHLDRVAARIREVYPGVESILRAPLDQLIVRLGTRTFALSAAMQRPNEWPIYVTPVPLPDAEHGSWECSTEDEALDTLRWPDEEPNVRRVSAEQIRK